MENAFLYDGASACVGHFMDGEIIEFFIGVSVLFNHDGSAATAPNNVLQST